MLLEEDKMKQRWQEYMNDLYGSEKEKKIFDRPLQLKHKSKITDDEILKAIKSLKSNKAAGHDEIPIEYIKSAGATTRKDVVKLIQRIYEGERIPEEWLTTIFVPIPKKEWNTEMRGAPYNCFDPTCHEDSSKGDLQPNV